MCFCLDCSPRSSTWLHVFTEPSLEQFCVCASMHACMCTCVSTWVSSLYKNQFTFLKKKTHLLRTMSWESKSRRWETRQNFAWKLWRLLFPFWSWCKRDETLLKTTPIPCLQSPIHLRQSPRGIDSIQKQSAAVWAFFFLFFFWDVKDSELALMHLS